MSSEVRGMTRGSFLQALLADYESRCRSAFEFGEAELRPHVPRERFEAARLVLDSVARILSCTDESQKPTLGRDALIILSGESSLATLEFRVLKI